jgi:hypothetical protein
MVVISERNPGRGDPFNGRKADLHLKSSAAV